MISKTAEYALRAVVVLATSEGRQLLSPQVAERTRVPQAYMAKVLQTLARAGLVRSQRGLGGGFTLARAAEEIAVLDVVDAVDPIERIEICPLGIGSHDDCLCPLHRRLDQAAESIRSGFASTTVHDLVAADRAVLCSASEVEES